jgi:hypothetical protein
MPLFFFSSCDARLTYLSFICEPLIRRLGVASLHGRSMCLASLSQICWKVTSHCKLECDDRFTIWTVHFQNYCNCTVPLVYHYGHVLELTISSTFITNRNCCSAMTGLQYALYIFFYWLVNGINFELYIYGFKVATIYLISYSTIHLYILFLVSVAPSVFLLITKCQSFITGSAYVLCLP